MTIQDRGQGKGMSAMSMRDLLRMEVETQSRVLINNLLQVEKGNLTDKHLEAMMRAAHSMKGGARIAGLQPAVELAHVMEDQFVAIRAGKFVLQGRRVDMLLKAVDLLTELAQAGVLEDKLPEEMVERATAMRDALVKLPQEESLAEPVEMEPVVPPREVLAPVRQDEASSQRTVRVSVESMNRMMALVGELSVKDKVSAGISTEAFQARRRVREINRTLEALKHHLNELDAGEHWQAELNEVVAKIAHVDEFLGHSAGVLETHDARTSEITGKMKREVIAHRMQPFGDVALGFRRLIRDLGQKLGKEVTLGIIGIEVGVDRDIMERLNAPLTHLLQNAVDHGIGKPQERIAAGKPACGNIFLTAQHRGGLLSIVVEDDGQGIDLERLREAVVSRKLVSEGVAAALQEQELIEFLFLPNFTLSRKLTEVSGRGVGLDLVRHTLREVRGTVRVASQTGKGTRFEITLPVTLIVVRCLVVEIAGELFALPVGRIARALQAGRDTLQSLEGRQYLMMDGHQVGLVSAQEILDLQGSSEQSEAMAVVVMNKGHKRYGLVVDRFVGERQLVERPMDPRLGKVEDIASASVLDDGTAVLILDVDDVLHSIERLSSGRSLRKIMAGNEVEHEALGRHVLVVDDSITVREVERGLLGAQGYRVDVAVDGSEGWNALRTGKYDLLITDVDMPRMNGIELVKLVRADARLKDLPVIIISYKDREEDRLSGLDAGADRYLTKGSFQDDTFVETVAELLGQSGIGGGA